MAAALCMNSFLAYSGPFGAVVAPYLRDFVDDMLEIPRDPGAIPRKWPVADAFVLVGFNHAAALCQVVDEVCRERQIPFLPLMLDSTELRLGPVIVPKGGGCWPCWKQRLRQHSRAERAQVELLAYYEKHPTAGPAGFSEPMAIMAAAQLVRALRLCSTGEIVPGFIWQWNLFTGQVQTARLIGVHDCPRCGLRRPIESRTYAELAESLAPQLPARLHGKGGP